MMVDAHVHHCSVPPAPVSADHPLYSAAMALTNLMAGARPKSDPETKHSESRLVARPDSNHPGSNDSMASMTAPTGAPKRTQEEWDALVHPLYRGAVLFPCPECDSLCHRDSYVATDFMARDGEAENPDAFVSRLEIETEALEEVLTPDTTLSELLEVAAEWIMCSPG